MNDKKNTAMIARLLIGFGLKTYMASGSMILYVKKRKNALQNTAKKITIRKEEIIPATNKTAFHTKNA